MAKTTKNDKTEEKKIVTKYDRKMQKRKEEALKAERNKKITIGSIAAIVVVAIIGFIIWTVSSYQTVHKKYIKVNDESVSGIEFDFYYGISKNENLSQSLYGTMTYGEYYASYLGYDSSKSDVSQKYSSSENYTWYDYFANGTVNTIKKYKALLLDAENTGFTYDNFDTDYEKLQSDIQSAADDKGVSVKEYYKSVFGKNATETNLKPYIEKYLKAEAYEAQLQEDLLPTDEQIKAYYNENKDTYDQVTYRQFVIAAQTEGDENSLAEAKTKADDMASQIKDEASFAQKCREYATSDESETYNEDNASLKENTYKTSADEVVADWLFDDARNTGDVTVIEDKDNSKYYVLYFVNKTYDETNDQKISDELLSNSYEELITSYTDSMNVDNIGNRIKMLSK